MNPSRTIAPASALSEKEQNALLNLLADDDPEIYRTVRDRIFAEGPQAATWLKKHLLHDDPVIRRRAREILDRFSRRRADDEFLAFCLNNGEDLPLEEGMWLLALTRYPGINVQAYQALLDLHAGEVAQRLPKGASGEDTLKALNIYLFEDLGFAGNQRDYYDPQNSYLNRVLDRRTGNPINLCALYLLLGRRLKLPLSGIGLPGHFICRYQSTGAEFFIDAFNHGRILTKADCVQYLLQGSFSIREEYLTPCSSRRMLLRICGNLHQISIHREEQEEATRFQRYMVALAK